ncbi:MAG TPA: hypothetical protein VJT71_15435 [Pyrinomonadaceae bacterium]|nr:hypothetical protein [Pyrinomonadaceae bacterium]
MKIRIRKVVGVPLILGTAIIVVATFSMFTARSGRWPGSIPQENSQLRVTNETTSLQPLSVTQENMGDEILVTLQLINAGGKPLVAYQLLKQNTTMLTTDGATTGWALNPGTTDTVRLMIPNTDKRLMITAVIFDDGSGEGNSQSVKDLLDYRLGVKAQFDRAIPFLRRLLSNVQATRATSVRELLNLPDRFEGANLSVAKSEGAKHAKQLILGRLNIPTNSSSALHEPDPSRVEETIKMLEKALTKLEPRPGQR